MDPSHQMAERTADAIWHGPLRYALIEATPRRPGRGRRTAPLKGRRRASDRECLRAGQLAGEVLRGLRAEALSPGLARRMIRESGMEPSLRIAATREEFVEAVAICYGESYFLWTYEEIDGVLRIQFVTRHELT